MHELATQSDCRPEPVYNASVCGFQHASAVPGECVALDGCGTPLSYFFFVSFTMIIT